MKFFVYILKCNDGSYYTGSTSNVQKRINEHSFSKFGAKSLRGKLPVELIYQEIFKTRNEALKREIEIKSWNRQKKVELVQSSL